MKEIKYDIPEELLEVFRQRKDQLIARNGKKWFDELLEGKHSLSEARRAMLPLKPLVDNSRFRAMRVLESDEELRNDD